MDERPTPAPMAQLAAALAKAQGLFTNPERNREVTIRTKTAGTYKFKYAELSTILDVVRKPLADNGLSVVQMLVQRGELLFVRTMLLHESGEHLAMEVQAGSVARDIKDVGGSITYIRRYSISALLNIASEGDVDDDGVRAGDGEPMPKPERQRPAAQPAVQPSWPWLANPLWAPVYPSPLHVWLEMDRASLQPVFGDVEKLDGAALVSLEDKIPKRRQWAFGAGYALIVECCDRDMRLVTGALLSRGNTEPAGQKTPVAPEPAPAQTAPPETARAPSPLDEKTLELAVPPVGVLIDVEAPGAETIPGVIALKTEELAAVNGMPAPLVLALIAAPGNGKLFAPEQAAAVAAANTGQELFTGAWLAGPWLQVHEASKDRRIKARRLLRMALIALQQGCGARQPTTTEHAQIEHYRDLLTKGRP